MGALLVRGVLWLFSGATSIIGAGPVIAVLFGAATTAMIGAYIKGRMDCSASYELAAAQDAIKHLNEQIAALKAAAELTEEMAGSYYIAEAANEALVAEIVGNPDDGDGCAGPRFLQRLSRLK